jgi:hypothetical protein
MPSSRPKPSSRVALAYYGEVITSDEAYTRIQAQAERKLQTKVQQKKSKKPKRTQASKAVEEKDENKCQGCLNMTVMNARKSGWVVKPTGDGFTTIALGFPISQKSKTLGHAPYAARSLLGCDIS